ncbi:hypothetical protein BOX15_Mlig004312g1 [Macrostomum lignano]|uniref:Cadherin domain-containing protein n=1 Tax=Macrostomum lignano TaxID=282301 RepID=A0A267GE09_9PLAT|nr:hypothetical protein BOX15_Mlig004312g1 [Macrostomum lignano]
MPFRLDQSDRNRLTLLVTGELDREKQPAYKMRLLAIDGGRPALTGTLSITVEIQDINDESPVFNQIEYSARLSEDAAIGTEVARVRATDNDAGPNGDVHYSLSHGSAQFIIRSHDGAGIVTLRSKLDAETLTHIVVYIVAKDRGYPPKTSEAKLTVTVDDVNDEKPQIEIFYLNPDSTAPRGSRGLLNENANSENVAKAEVTDRDSGSGGRVSCDADNESFTLVPLHLSDAAGAASTSSRATSVGAVNRREFLIRSRAPLDREASDSLQFNIVCSDDGRPVRLTGSAAVRLRLVDVNDNPPVFDRRSGYDFQLLENEPSRRGGRQLVGIVTASDKDEGENARLVYSIEQDPSGAFQIDNATGQLFAVHPLDREKLAAERQPAQVLLRVSAADSNPSHPRAITDVRVIVLDRNDCPPRFVTNNRRPDGVVGISGGADYEFSVEETAGSGANGGPSSTVVGAVRAEDEDEPGRIEYAMETTGLDPDTANSFRVDPNTGQVRAIRQLDREARAIYVFTVTARDSPRLNSGDPQLTGSATVTVHVLDVNDCSPEFIVPKTSGESVSVADNAKAGYTVTTVKARDADLNKNGEVTYTILPDSSGSGAGRGLFKMDRTGVLFMDRSLTPRDARPEPYELIVEAADQGKPSLRTRTTLRVFVVPADSVGVGGDGGDGSKSAGEAAGERRGGKTGGDFGNGLGQQRTRTTIVLGLVVFFFLLLIVVTFAVLILLRPCRRGGASGGGGSGIGGGRPDPAGEAVSGGSDLGDFGSGAGIRDFKTVRGYLVAGNGKSGEPATLIRGSIDGASPPELYNLLTTNRQPAVGALEPAESTPMSVVSSMPAARLSDYQSLRPATASGTGRRRKPPAQQQQQQQQQQHPVPDGQSPVYYQAGSPQGNGPFGTTRGFEQRTNSAGLRTAAAAAGATTTTQQIGSTKSQPVTPMDRRKFSAFNPYADASFV